MDTVAATDPAHDPPAAPETAAPVAAAAAAQTGAQGSVPEGANNGANEALRDENNGALTDADQVVITAAQKEKQRQAKKAAKNALLEKERRKKALLHQKQVTGQSGKVYNVKEESTEPERKGFIDAKKPAVIIGTFVQVASALAIPGRARYGGK